MFKKIIEHFEIDKLLQFSKIYLCFIALVCLCFGGWFWLRLVGVYSHPLWRLDLMPMQWQMLTITLAIVCPVAAIGLWFGALWGIILWVIASLAQCIAFTIYSQYFEFLPLIAFFHFLLLIIFCIFNIAIYLKKRQKPVALTEF